MILFLEIILVLHLLVLLYCIFHVNQKYFPEKLNIDNNPDLPFVSILVAARNEEENILQCLESLSKLNYSQDKYEVLIGNDASTDSTAQVVKGFINSRYSFRLLNIQKNLGQAKGKANVLAHLARQAKGQYFFITDADMTVPVNWIQSHLKYFSGDVYMTSGSTLTIPKKSLFSRLQNMEWIYFMALFNAIDHIKSITAMGNNMAFRADKYFEIGGYENLPFSVTEDIQLMNAFTKSGYRHTHILEAENLSWQKPLQSIKDLLKQRKRWFQGGKKQPFYIWTLFLLYAAFLPAVFILLLYNWEISIYILGAKCLTDAVLLYSVSRRLKVNTNILWLPFFELYQFIINPLILIYSVFTRSVEWKERKY